jgi:hypothetical protein
MAGSENSDLIADYVRPQWTGKPLVYSDGRPDEEWAECPSCLTFHHARSESCNGKREPWPAQCEAALGEIRCHRPGNHLGPHQALSKALSVEWAELIDGAVAPDEPPQK